MNSSNRLLLLRNYSGLKKIVSISDFNRRIIKMVVNLEFDDWLCIQQFAALVDRLPTELVQSQFCL